MQLHFKQTQTTIWNTYKWFELFIDHLSTGIYYPNKELADYETGDLEANGVLQLEINASREVADKLMELYEPFAFDEPRTRFEVAVAIDANKRNLWDVAAKVRVHREKHANL